MDEERMLQFFEYAHLPAHLQEISLHFHGLAHQMVALLPPSPERTKSLNDLLASKDWAVRARVAKK